MSRSGVVSYVKHEVYLGYHLSPGRSMSGLLGQSMRCIPWLVHVCSQGLVHEVYLLGQSMRCVPVHERSPGKSMSGLLGQSMRCVLVHEWSPGSV